VIGKDWPSLDGLREIAGMAGGVGAYYQTLGGDNGFKAMAVPK